MVRRSQVSTEYAVVVAFIFLSIAAFMFSSYQKATQSYNAFEVAKLDKAGNSIIEETSRINYYSEQSKATFEIVLPANVQRAYVENKRDIVFEYLDDGKKNVKVYHAPMEVVLDFADLNQGLKKVVVTAKAEGYIGICIKKDDFNCDYKCDLSKGENATLNPAECCKSDCTGCRASGPDASYMGCISDHIYHPECDNHNGCNYTVHEHCNDQDSDGYGLPGSYLCDNTHTDALSDCNDNNINIHPNRHEDCGITGDENCNGQADCADPECAISCGIALPLFTVKGSYGDTVASFYSNGDIIISGDCIPNCGYSAPTGSFVIQNSGGQNRAYIDSYGNMCIANTGLQCRDHTATDCMTYTDNMFVVEDSAGKNVSSFDQFGRLCLTGNLTVRGNPTG